MTSLKVKTLTADDWEKFHGSPLTKSVVGFSGEIDGEIVGTFTLVYNDGILSLSASYDDVVKKYPVTLIKVGKRMMNIIESKGVPVVVVSDPKESTADNLLKHLGFSFEAKSTVGDVYAWQPQRSR